ncbi:ferritin-like domain-containing protein [Patulibacter minatonensis]|uniref:ferritin-like domain-containing protein n=1 Tax=Patulibacter minatonensis TaxID=298163 RepID=UPI0004BB3EB5|nr:ferritin-like domain-containing protein [Patulibacter minatonensis]
MNHFITTDEPSRELAGIEVEGTTRSAFLLRTALVTGGIYGASAVSPAVRNAFAQSKDPESNQDQDIIVLNFALVLEYLEATFYERALKQVSGLSSDTKKLVEQIQEDEEAHVKALTAAVEQLGGDKAARPKFNFDSALTDEKTFLKTANTLEDTGVSAYNGAAPMIKTKKILGAAGSIVQVEARHAALVRLERDKPPAPQAFDVASKQADVLVAVKPFIVQG